MHGFSFYLPPFPQGWLHYLLGGMIMGLGVAILYVLTGRIGGMSSVFSSTWSYLVQTPFFQQTKFTSTRVWRLVYALGLIVGAFLWMLFFHDGQALGTQIPWWKLLVGGMFVGYGARLGGGCTSGHGICGLAWLQPASLAAVVTFMVTATITANLFNR